MTAESLSQDAELLRLFHQYRIALSDRGRAPNAAAYARASEQIHSCVKAITETPARSFAGIAAKLALCGTMTMPASWKFLADERFASLQGAYEDALRLAGLDGDHFNTMGTPPEIAA